MNDAMAQPTIFGIAYPHAGAAGSPPPSPQPSTLHSLNPNTGAANPIGLIGFDQCGALDNHPTSGILYAHCIRSMADQDCFVVVT